MRRPSRAWLRVVGNDLAPDDQDSNQGATNGGGLRLLEALHLHVKAIDLDRREITVTAALAACAAPSTAKTQLLRADGILLTKRPREFKDQTRPANSTKLLRFETPTRPQKPPYAAALMIVLQGNASWPEANAPTTRRWSS